MDFYRLKTTLLRAISSGLLILMISCTDASSSSVKDDPTSDWEHKAWVAKTGRVLSAGQPLSVSRTRDLALLQPEAVVDQLMNDPNFGDMLLDFNLYYLGFKPGRLYFNQDDNVRSYDSFLFAKSQAINAAQEALRGGDYFKLFDMDQPRFISPLERPNYEDIEAPDDATEHDVRLLWIAKTVEIFDRHLVGFQSDADPLVLDKAKGCRLRQEDGDGQETIQSFFDNIGVSFVSALDMSLYQNILLNINCGDSNVPVEDIVRTIGETRDMYAAFIDFSQQFTRENYQIRSVADIKPLPKGDLYPYFNGGQFSFFGFWNSLPNSSTNYNRKRASYFLKTYFCDDLTPLNVVAPDTPHPGDRHASDPGCQACHYKLDPMAGFFKNSGLLGIDFGNNSFHVFDDNATIFGDKLTEYRNSWPETGYVRSTRDSSQNSYGTTLEDLFGIIRTAPEVKQCLVRRMAEYVLGRDQVFDGGWIQHLTDSFEAEPNTTAGIRTVVKKLSMSNTFRQRDPQPDQCYDFFPADQPVNALPCAVNHVVRNTCVMCHRNASANNGMLSLKEWIEIGRDQNNNPIMSFKHLDANGQQRPKSETFTVLAERLNSSDPNLSMPKNMDMNAVEKVRLYKWITEEAGRNQ